MTDIAIHVEGLEKRFGSVNALAGIDLAVPAGTVFGLLGPNGAGKTTAVRILTTILRPDAGRAAVLGHDVVRHPQAVREVIGLAGQYAAVDENLTAEENLQLVGRLAHLPRGVVRPRAAELLEQFGLAEASGRSVRTFSGGMRRRLDLAAALVHEPPVLFLDEPTTGLDPVGRNDLWAVIESLVTGGTTVLLTTQYLEEADRLADQLAVIDHGRVIANGTPAELKAGLGATVLSIGFADPGTAQRLAPVLTDLGTAAAHVDGAVVELTVDNGPKMLVEVLHRLGDQRVEPTTLSLREPSLDDVFIALTGHRSAGDADTDPEAGPA